MAKSANLYARIEPDIKEQAEMILSSLGIPASGAITMFYRQIILHGGLPFEIKLPKHPLDISKMDEKEFNSCLEEGYSDVVSDKTVNAKTAFEEIRKEYRI